MNSIARTIVWAGFLALCLVGWGQVSSTVPKHYTTATYLFFDNSLLKLKLSHNPTELIRQEVLDTNTLQTIARFAGITEAELATIQIVPETNRDWLLLYQLGSSDKAFNFLRKHLPNYIHARQDGHTKAFCLAAFSNRVDVATIADPDLRILYTNHDLLALSFVRKNESGTSTNKAGAVASQTTTTTTENGTTVTNETVHVPKVDEVCRWVSYIVVDGEIAWSYFVEFNADNSLDSVHESKRDAKEYDPEYQNVIKEVVAEVQTEMKQSGSYGKFGSVHEFTHLKKEKLKARGIEWRSPSELNPGASFD